jgi:CheY-like chemotaxis protein
MSKTILCVDDSVTMQTAAEYTLINSGYEFVGAKSAEEALSSAKSNKPSLILADAVMPGKTGYELCSDIKSDPSLADVPVIIVCGNSEAYDEPRGIAAGCDGHVTKPWDTTKLLAKLGEFVAAGAKPVGEPAAKPAAAAVNKTMMGIPAMQAPASAAEAVPVAAVASSEAVTPAMGHVSPAQSNGSAQREPMISGTPSRPIRLVLASQAESAATANAVAAGMGASEAGAMTGMSREMVEKVAWEVVPDLAEAIIRENLETLAAKAR